MPPAAHLASFFDNIHDLRDNITDDIVHQFAPSKFNKIEDVFEDNAVIKIKNLTVWTPEERFWWRRRPTKTKTTILEDGCIREGEFAAVIGPRPCYSSNNVHSGAGKTTFLVSLAGKCTLPSEGTVTVRGRNVKECHDAVEIVPQFEMFMDALSVMEHLVFMTEMKLGSCKDPGNQAIMATLIRELKLEPHKDTVIRALSGGEKRLLSLATSLLSNPQILICDEPTTGLDSYNALLVIGVLRKLSLNGRIVVASIHQPSYDLYKEFTTILLMAEGRLLFHGTQDACKTLFDSIHLRCPPHYNPAEFYIRAVSDTKLVQKLVEITHTSVTDEPSTVGDKRGVSQRSWLKQVYLLTWRQSLTLRRDIKSHLIQLLISVVITSLVLSVAYVGVSGTTQRGVQDVRGFLWLMTSEVAFGLAYSALYSFKYEIALFKREVGIYQCSAYFVSRFISFMPRCVVWPISYVTVATLFIELPNYIITTVELLVALISCGIAAIAYGLGMSALFTSTGIMGDVMPCVDLPLLLMSGAFLRLSSIPAWLYPVKYISHFYYTMDAASNIYWRQIDHIDCPINSTIPCVKDGNAVLIENGYSSNFVMQDGFGLLFVTVLWATLGYYGLKREERRGYAY